MAVYFRTVILLLYLLAYCFYKIWDNIDFFMIVIIEKLVLNALKLNVNWHAELTVPISRELNVPRDAVSGYEILSSSVDSRRGMPKILLKVAVDLKRSFPHLSEASAEELATLRPVELVMPEKITVKHPLVIGTGPAGISAAWYLAAAGCEPVILDRGNAADERVSAYKKFLQTRVLDVNSNLLIGEGGAGTFSDGKLYTGTKDHRGRFLKELWVKCGAPQEILWKSRPHIGSDNLADMSIRLRQEIIALGGTFRFNSEVAELIVENGCCRGVVLASGEKIYAPAVVLAPGLGGRDLLRRVCKYAAWEFKPFQTGCRVETPQETVDRAMYHLSSRPAALSAAEYHIVSRAEAGNVSSFCMCPGGHVVNATAWEGHSISNGMSCFDRGGDFANSCLITTLFPKDYGSAVELFSMFDMLEKNIFAAGGGDYTLPAQDTAAFVRGTAGLKNVSHCCDTGIVAARLDRILLPALRDALIPAVANFNRRIPGFAAQSKFIGAESFVSSPVRLLREPFTMENPLIKGLYPAGEGCGLAGGIVSAACDGIRVAEAVAGGQQNIL